MLPKPTHAKLCSLGRSALSLALSVSMALGCLPTPALAEMLDDGTLDTEVVELAAEATEDDALTVGEAVEAEPVEETAEPTEAEPVEETAEPTEAEPVEEATEAADNEPSAEVEEALSFSASTEPLVYAQTSDASSDELLTHYVEQLLYGESAETSDEPALTAQSMGYRLEGIDDAVFAELKQFARAVADGERTDTVFSMPMSELSDQLSWTEGELGYPIVVDGGINDEAMQAASAKVSPNVPLILDTLLNQQPYEMYWYDKTAGVSYGSISFGASNDGGEWSLYVTNDTFDISFSVAEGYAAGQYQTSTAQIDRVHTAIANANQVISDAWNAHYGDSYQILHAFKDAICDYVDYDYDAASGGVAFGDPWQLINVFDGDPDTKVVCEGYSKAFQYLCDEATLNDARAYCVTGTMSGGTGAGPHMWNIVNMGDNRNYLVDVTNCDEGSVGNQDLLFIAVPTSGDSYTSYTFDCNGTDVTYAYDSDASGYYTVRQLELSEAAWGQDGATESLSDFYLVLSEDEFRYTSQPVALSCSVVENYSYSYQLVEGLHYTLAYFDENKEELSGAPTEPGNYYVLARATEGHGFTGETKMMMFTIIEPLHFEELQLNMPAEFTMVYDEDCLATFTAPHAGTYAIMTRTLLSDIFVYDNDELMDYFARKDLDNYNLNDPMTLELSEGQTVYLSMRCNYEDSGKVIEVGIYDEGANVANGTASLATSLVDQRDGEIVLQPIMTDASGNELEEGRDYRLLYYANENKLELREDDITNSPMGKNQMYAVYQGIGNYYGLMYVPFTYFVPYNTIELAETGVDVFTSGTVCARYTAQASTEYALKVGSRTGAFTYEIYADDRLETLMTSGSVASGASAVSEDFLLEEGQSFYVKVESTSTYHVELTVLRGKDISGFSGSIPDVWCNGLGTTTEIDHSTVTIVNDEGNKLTYGEDFEFLRVDDWHGNRYQNKVYVGTPTIVYEGKGLYRGTIGIPVNVLNTKSLKYGSITVLGDSFAYTGSSVTPEVEVKDREGNLLVSGTDYVLYYYDTEGTRLQITPYYVGEYQVCAFGIGSYAGLSSPAPYSIVFDGEQTFDLADAVIRVPSVMWTGSEVKTNPIVELCGKRLVEGTDFTAEYANNVEIGPAATITLAGIGEYTGSVTRTYRILGSLKPPVALMSVSQDRFVWSGNECRPQVTVMFNGVELHEGVDYTVTYDNNVNVGTAAAHVRGIGNYTDGLGLTYHIDALDLANADVKLSKTSYTYDGKAKKPKVTVVQGECTLEEGAHYTVAYKNNVKAGTASVVLTSALDGSTVTRTFKITKGVNPMTAKAKKATVQVAYSKVKAAKQVLASNVAVAKAQGTVTYANASTNATAKKFKVDAKTGKVTVPKGTKAGTYQVKVRVVAAGNANWNKSKVITVTYKVKVYLPNTLKAVRAKASVTANFATLRTKAVVTARNVTVSGAKGTVSYANASSNATAKKFIVNRTSGKVTVPKGTKKGTYQVKVKVTAAGTTAYAAKSVTVTYNIVVK